MEKAKNRIGEKHITNEGYTIEIVKYFNRVNCTIQFENGTIIENRDYGNIKKGNIKNPYHKCVYGIGYFGVGKYSGVAHPKTYRTWKNMLTRCYYEKYQENQPTYTECLVNEKWHNFQVFAQWYEENYKEGFALDKDILIKGNKIYSPEKCCFIPQQINTLFTKRQNNRGNFPIGVSKVRSKFRAYLSIGGKRAHIGYFNTPEEAFQAHKTAKEKYIKELAEKWKDKIAEKTYQALINYQVEITD